jgi:hypothetical protein
VASLLLDHTSKIFVQRIERIGLQFRIGAAQLLFNPVYGMKEVAAVKLQPVATEFPVGAKEEKVSEDLVIFILQYSPADKRKIGYVFFPLPGVGTPAIVSVAEFQRHRTRMRSQFGALSKTVEAGAKNRPKNTVARRFPHLVNGAHTLALATVA